MVAVQHYRLSSFLLLALVHVLLVVVVFHDVASALQVRAIAPRQRTLRPKFSNKIAPLGRVFGAESSSTTRNSSLLGSVFHSKNNDHESRQHSRTQLESSVAVDGESYSVDAAAAVSTRRASLVQTVASRLRWPILAALMFLLTRQASPVIVPALKSLLQRYDQCMLARPLITKVLTGAILATLGDALAQSSAAKKAATTATPGAAPQPYDVRRAASFAAFDSCYRMFQHVAFPLIISTCTGNFLGSIFRLLSVSLSAERLHILAVCERTMAYQLGVVPLLYYPVFFLFTGFMQGLDLKGTLERAKTNFLPCWKRNLMFWIPVQTVMFGSIPEQWQIPFVCVMGIIWSSILSVTAGKATSEKKSA